MEEARLHPIWKEAAKAIAARVSRDGYGFLISMEEIHEMLETRQARPLSLWKDVRKDMFDFLEKVEELKRECLHQHRILLFNQRGQGYQVLTPDDQVTKGWERQHEKVRKHLRKSLDVVVNTDSSALSEQGQKNRDRNIQRTVFIMSAADKRRIPAVERKKIA